VHHNQIDRKYQADACERRSATQVVDEGPRGPKTYAIVAEGRAERRHWLLKAAPEGHRRNVILLRVLLFDTVEADEVPAGVLL
jgi:hypothetical protein